MSDTFIIAVGTYDDPAAASQITENVTSMIEIAKSKGFENIVIVPPNPEEYPAQNQAVLSAASAAGASVEAGEYSVADPEHLTRTSAESIRSKYPTAVIAGDDNAVRINNNSNTDMASFGATTDSVSDNVESSSFRTDGADDLGSSGIAITEQDKNLLNMIAKYESGGDYTAHWRGEKDPSLTNRTLRNAREFQERMIERSGARGDSSAIGRYQLIRVTFDECVGYLNLDIDNTRFTPQVQDAMILARLEKFRQYKEWKSGSITTNAFALNLAKEFASLPVPFATQGSKQFVQKGQSYYAGDGLNKVGTENTDTYLEALEDIKKGGPGNVTIIDVTTSSTPNNASPTQGQSYRRIAETSATGGRPITGGRRTSQLPSLPIVIPPVIENVYEYDETDFYDDRYDFRTGRKIRDIGVNDIDPVSSNPNYLICDDQTGMSGPATSATPTSPTAGPDDGSRGTPSQPWTDQEAQTVENLARFNAFTGDGDAKARLSPGERAYAESKGYIRSPQRTPDNPVTSSSSIQSTSARIIDGRIIGGL